jgi:deoxycytidine triphosphate deaminase
VWNHLEPRSVLADHDLQALVNADEVVTGETMRPRTKESCVELTIGRTVHRPFRPHGEDRVQLQAGKVITVEPGEVVSIVTNEHLDLPLDGYGRIYPKGRMTTIGLSIASTNVDPGFRGALIISVTNASGAPIRLECGASIAKLEISKLPSPNTTGYFGAHGSGHDSLPFDPYMFAGTYKQRVAKIEKTSNVLAAFAAVFVFVSICVLFGWTLRTTLMDVWKKSPGEILAIVVPLFIAGLLWVSKMIYVRLSTRRLEHA